MQQFQQASIQLKRVTLTIIKPFKESKLGIGIEQKAGGLIGVTFIASDSVFICTKLAVAGVTLERINGIECTNGAEAARLINETVGQMTVVIIIDEFSTAAL